MTTEYVSYASEFDDEILNSDWGREMASLYQEHFAGDNEEDYIVHKEEDTEYALASKHNKLINTHIK